MPALQPTDQWVKYVPKSKEQLFGISQVLLTFEKESLGKMA